MRMRRTCLLVLAALGACGDPDAASPDGDVAADEGGEGDADAEEDGGAEAEGDGGEVVDWPPDDIPTSTVPEEGIRRDIFQVAGVAPPDNPVTGASTPAELDAIQVLRYREDVDPPAPARAIVLAVPGFLSGGAVFDALARSLVRRGRLSGEAVEVWAIDRRSNLLEDLRGMDAAEALGNAEAANGYYFGSDTVGGEAFAGFLAEDRVGYISEWGLAMLVRDVRRVIEIVPADRRRGHLFLMGHSLGAAFTEAFASWRFEDGTRGAELVAGLILIDGALAAGASTEDEYLHGSGTGLLARPGLEEIRESAPCTRLPMLGLEVYTRAEVLAMRALYDPAGVIDDPGRDALLSILLDLNLDRMPDFTNRAALGWAFDTQSLPLSFAAMSLGEATGGAVESYTSLLFGVTMLRPADPGATYDWTDALDTDPPEYTRIADFAHALVDGRTNFMEWYFPWRLAADVAAVGGTDVPEDGFQAAAGLRAFDRELVDAPVLAVAAALLGPDGYDALPDRMAPEVGPGRRNSGASRDDPAGLGLRVVDASALSHVDPLSGADRPHNPAPGAVETFVLEQVSETGSVEVPFLEGRLP